MPQQGYSQTAREAAAMVEDYYERLLLDPRNKKRPATG
jgi:hypothetical protein